MKAEHNLVSRLPSSLVSKFGLSSRRSIKFYHRDEPYYEFTNFYQARVFIDGKKWPSTEHYFQAQKFVGTPYVDMIRLKCLSAREAFQLSRDPTVSQWRRSDWDAVKDDIMLKALRCKFAQHSDLREKLWKTGDKKLIEHTTNDSYWADGGGSGRGLNKLGKLLMKVRDDIVAKRGRYVEPVNEPSKKSSDRVSFGSRLKRSSSMTDLSKQTTSKRVSPSLTVFQTDDLFSYQLHSAPLGTSRTGLRRSSSFSSIPPSNSLVPKSESGMGTRLHVLSDSIGSSNRNNRHSLSHLHESSKLNRAMFSTSTSSSRHSQPPIKPAVYDYQQSLTKGKNNPASQAKLTKPRHSSSKAHNSCPASQPPPYKPSSQVTQERPIQSLPKDKSNTTQSRPFTKFTAVQTYVFPNPPTYKYSRDRPQSRNPVTGKDWY